MYRIMQIELPKIPRHIDKERGLEELQNGEKMEKRERVEAEKFRAQCIENYDFRLFHQQAKENTEKEMAEISNQLVIIGLRYASRVLNINFPEKYLKLIINNGVSIDSFTNAVDLMHTGNHNIFEFEAGMSIVDKIKKMTEYLMDREIADRLDMAAQLSQYIRIEDIGIRLKDIFEALYFMPDEPIADYLQFVHDNWYSNPFDDDSHKKIYRKNYWQFVVENVFERLKNSIREADMKHLIQEYCNNISELANTSLLQVDINLQEEPDNLQGLYYDIKSRISTVEQECKKEYGEKIKWVLNHVSCMLNQYLCEIEKLFVKHEILDDDQLYELRKHL